MRGRVVCLQHIAEPSCEYDENRDAVLDSPENEQEHEKQYRGRRIEDARW
jgi:hypothetical protein